MEPSFRIQGTGANHTHPPGSTAATTHLELLRCGHAIPRSKRSPTLPCLLAAAHRRSPLLPPAEQREVATAMQNPARLRPRTPPLGLSALSQTRARHYPPHHSMPPRSLHRHAQSLPDPPAREQMLRRAWQHALRHAPITNAATAVPAATTPTHSSSRSRACVSERPIASAQASARMPSPLPPLRPQATSHREPAGAATSHIRSAWPQAAARSGPRENSAKDYGMAGVDRHSAIPALRHHRPHAAAVGHGAAAQMHWRSTRCIACCGAGESGRGQH